MNKPKIYIAGKVSGLKPLEAALKFQRTESCLRGYGFLPINPLEVVNDFNCPWQKAMRLGIIEMMKADALFMQHDWRDSQGSSIEYEIALNLAIPIYEDMELLAAFFGLLPVHRCTHPEDKQQIKVLGSGASCETTVLECRQCGKWMGEPETDC